MKYRLRLFHACNTCTPALCGRFLLPGGWKGAQSIHSQCQLQTWVVTPELRIQSFGRSCYLGIIYAETLFRVKKKKKVPKPKVKLMRGRGLVKLVWRARETQKKPTAGYCTCSWLIVTLDLAVKVAILM